MQENKTLSSQLCQSLDLLLADDDKTENAQNDKSISTARLLLNAKQQKKAIEESRLAQLSDIKPNKSEIKPIFEQISQSQLDDPTYWKTKNQKPKVLSANAGKVKKLKVKAGTEYNDRFQHKLQKKLEKNRR